MEKKWLPTDKQLLNIVGCRQAGYKTCVECPSRCRALAKFTAKKIAKRLQGIWKDDIRYLEEAHRDVVKAINELLKEMEES